MKKRWLVSISAAAIAGACVAGGTEDIGALRAGPRLSLAACDVAGIKGKARCGTFEVWENRATHAGRRISLKVVVLPATGSPVERDAITFFAGGPGQAATNLAAFLAAQFTTLRQHRDVLLVDQRGTGGSYGTRAALVFLRRHPEHARVAVLQGVAPPDEPMPRDFPRHAEQAIERLFADCAADPSCHAAFPAPQSDLRAIVERARAAAVPVTILEPTTGDEVRVSLSRNLLGEALRYLMYESSTALFVPVLLRQAATGDFGPIAEFALGSRKQLVNSLGQGLYLSVTCAEDLPFVDPAVAQREAANTFLGDYRYQQQRAACDAWVRGAVARDFDQPVRSQTPVVMFSGAWDPVTPPSNAERAAATLPRSLSVVVAAGGHDYEGLAGADRCVAAITNDVVQRGTEQGLDTSCVKAIRRPPFPTRPVETKTVTLSAAQLHSLAGRYVGTGAPPLEIRADRGRLVGRLEGAGAPVVLAPVSPTRLRLLGDIGSYLDVQLQDGKATGMKLEQAGTTTFTWKRETQ